MNSIRYKGNVRIISNDDGKFIYKKNKKKNKNIYNYLISKNFLNFPRVYSDDNSDTEITEYISDIIDDNSIKLEDLINIVTLLHSKTVHYRTVDLDEVKKIYEDYKEKYEYLYSYYVNIEKMIEEEIYMSPSNYYFILNISSLFRVLDYGNRMIEEWYQHISNQKTLRFVLAHHNLSYDHLLKNNNPYLISWDLADFDFNSLDLASIFKNNYHELEIDTLPNLYNSKYQLREYEYELFVANICLLKQINFNNLESKKISEIVNFNTYVSKIYSYILKQDSNNSNY